MRRWKAMCAASALLFVFALFSPPLKTDACSIDVEPAFTIRTRPDFPIKNFLAGQLGVIQPTYYRKYLVVAYRYLNGAPLSASEQKILQDEWEPERTQQNEAAVIQAGPRLGPVAVWNNALSTTYGGTQVSRGFFDPLGISTYRRYGTNQIDFYNCLPDAFTTATIRLRAYQDKFGIKSDEVREWVDAQELVFSNCGRDTVNGGGPSAIPAESPEAALAMIREDRAYQIAAANFYAGKYDEAKRRFDQIAADSDSPWHGIAPLLAGRAVLREATINDGNEGMDEKELADAEAIFRSVMADRSRAEYHAAAQRLVNFAEARLRPEAELKRLAEKLSTTDGADLKQDLIDYTVLLDQMPRKGNQNAFRDDMTDWIFTFQARGDAKLQARAFAKWKETGSNAWLAAALITANANSASNQELLTAVRSTKPGSPIHSIATFHRLRLEYEAGRSNAVRPEIDALLRDGDRTFSLSTINLLKALRMRMATNLDDFLAFAPRTAAATEIDGSPEPWDPKEFWRGEQQSQVMFDEDGAYVMNHMLPLSMLASAAESEAIPRALRPQLAVAAWARAVILDDEKSAAAMAELCEEEVPEMKTALAEYERAPAGEARKFAAVFLMLHFPGVQIDVRTGPLRSTPIGVIDSFRDNWWSSANESPNYYDAAPGAVANGSPLESIYPDRKIHAPDFLTADELAMAESEWKKISAEPAANYFGAIVLSWAKGHASDPRVPEALHLVVRATRYGNGDRETGAISKAAFELLHKKYAGSEWADKTPYWFNN